MKKIRVVMCPADRAPYLTFISNTLENMQRIVGGYIEAATMASDAVVICNEEGRLLCMPENRSLPVSGFVGDCFICGKDGEEFGDLSVKTAHDWLKAAKVKWMKQKGEEDNGV